VSGSDLGARRAAVLGQPIGHSLSPVLHRTAYARLGLTGWSYDAIECDEHGLAEFVSRCGPEWVGLSLTMPLKREALIVADTVTPLAAAIGAANTLVRGPAGWQADNTDAAGIVGALRESGLIGSAGPVAPVGRVGPVGPVGAVGAVGPVGPVGAVVLGAGGTAQAALSAGQQLGLAPMTVVVRDPRRSDELRATADRLGVGVQVTGGLLERALPRADVLISTLPAHAADAVRWAPGAAPRFVLDAVYAPWPTALAAAGATDGAAVASGLDMLLHQAIEQVRLFTGRVAPADAMRAALLAAANAR
jgi:shikimate dehydrogenase